MTPAEWRELCVEAARRYARSCRRRGRKDLAELAEAQVARLEAMSPAQVWAESTGQRG